jgi:uncharacterized damage-inducible protein DinB
MHLGFVEMFEYNAWATRTLLDACVDLSDEALDAVVPGVSGPVRRLLLHVVGAQQTFALRTKGRHHEGELTPWSAWPGFQELQRISEESSTELIEIARTLDPEALVDLPYQGKVYRYPARFFLVHAMEHGTEHRTEIKVALNHLGIETPDLDGWRFAAEKGYGEEV